jgi:hypothetical protein
VKKKFTAMIDMNLVMPKALAQLELLLNHPTSSTIFATKPRGQSYKTFYGRNLRIFVISYSVCPWQARKQ